jgi:hypothetical protein
MFVRKNNTGQIVGFRRGAVSNVEGWEKSTEADADALADFLANGAEKTEEQLDNADLSYYKVNVDPLVIKAILKNAGALGLDLTEARSIKNARRALRNKPPE